LLDKHGHSDDGSLSDTGCGVQYEMDVRSITAPPSSGPCAASGGLPFSFSPPKTEGSSQRPLGTPFGVGVGGTIGSTQKACSNASASTDFHDARSGDGVLVTERAETPVGTNGTIEGDEIGDEGDDNDHIFTQMLLDTFASVMRIPSILGIVLCHHTVVDFVDSANRAQLLTIMRVVLDRCNMLWFEHCARCGVPSGRRQFSRAPTATLRQFVAAVAQLFFG
jgi:hypothetical protein